MGLVWALWNFVKIRWQLYVHPGYIHTFRLFWFWLTANSESCRGHCSRWVMCPVIPWTWQITCIWTAVRKQSSFVFAGKRKLVFSGRRSKYLIEKQQFCFHCVCYQVDGGHVWLSIVKEITGPLYFKQPRIYTKLKAGGVIQECSENEADKMHCGHARNSDCQRCWFLQATDTDTHFPTCLPLFIPCSTFLGSDQPKLGSVHFSMSPLWRPWPGSPVSCLTPSSGASGYK